MQKKKRILYSSLISAVFFPIIFFWIFAEIGGLSEAIARPTTLFGFIRLGSGPERGALLLLVAFFGTAFVTTLVWILTWWLTGFGRSSKKSRDSRVRTAN